MPAIKNRFISLPSKGEISRWPMLAQASMSYLLSEILAQAQHPILILVQDSLLAAQLDRELAFFLPTTSTLLH
ncbi:MAG TPA: hypothetical protein VLH77_01665, partial [Gammaproteobacteria bacterium]|nr:hypothetical protein [Gammaproteobacteria bacterium]